MTRADRMPDRMVDRWRCRDEPAGADGQLYWHILINQAPRIQAFAVHAQRRLAAFPGLHLTPSTWLHLTLTTIGRSTNLTADDTTRLVDAARRRTVDIDPIDIETGRVLFHPEAVALSVRPRRALAQVMAAVVDATAETITGWNPAGHASDPWIPHVTLAYSAADQPTGPVVAALDVAPGDSAVTASSGRLEAVSLVDQRGRERLWDWHVLDTVTLGRSTSR